MGFEKVDSMPLNSTDFRLDSEYCTLLLFNLMNTSMMIAQLLGPIYLAIGVGMLVNCDHYKKMYDEVMKSKGMMYLGGVGALLVGLLILRVHGMWMSDWSVVITIIGWLATLKGLGLLIIPQQFLGWNKWVLSSQGMMVAKVLVWVLGLGLTYAGYVM